MPIISKENDSETKRSFLPNRGLVVFSSLAEIVIATLLESRCVDNKEICTFSDINSNDAKEEPKSLTDFLDNFLVVYEKKKSTGIAIRIRRKHWVKWEISRSPPAALTLRNK